MDIDWTIILAIIVAAIAYIYYQANKEIEFNPVPPPPPFKKDMNFAQLRMYDGIKDKRLLLALKGVIYDVSAASDFYGVGSGYHTFVGHDASVNLAKMSHEEQYLNKFGEVQLNKDEQDVLNDWVATFGMKYRVVGVVLKEQKIESAGNTEVSEKID